MSEVNEKQTQIDEQQQQQQPQQAESTPEKAEQKSEKEKVFTQSELEEILAKRLERERKKFADYEELKKKAEEYEKKLEEQRLAEMSEKERAEELARKAEEQAQQYAKQLEELQARVREEKIRNAFITAATAHNIAYIEDAWKLADLSAVEVGEDGSVKGIEDVVKALVENKPFLVAQQKPQPIGESSNHNNEQTKSAEQLLKEAAEKARRSGRIEDFVEYNKLKKELGK